jgi:hypothetical protein
VRVGDVSDVLGAIASPSEPPVIANCPVPEGQAGAPVMVFGAIFTTSANRPSGRRSAATERR